MIENELRVGTWNSEWCPPPSSRSPRGLAVERHLGDSIDAGIVVLTEARRWLWERSPYSAAAEPPTYPGTPHDGAKVAIASTYQLEEVPLGKVSELVRQNTVAVHVPDLDLRVVGIVVRYRAKAAYLAELAPVLRRLKVDRMIVAGDVNCVPGTPLWSQLVATLAEAGCTIETVGPHAKLDGERPLIDHVAVSQHFDVVDRKVWSRRDGGGVELSDHAASTVLLRERR